MNIAELVHNFIEDPSGTLSNTRMPQHIILRNKRDDQVEGVLIAEPQIIIGIITSYARMAWRM